MCALVRSSFFALILAAPLALAADDAKTSAGSKAIHDAMMKGMESSHQMKMSGDPDRDFASMMIQHHQNAIEMSRAVLKHGKDPEIRKKAQEIIAMSEKDISELKKHKSGHHGDDH